MILRPVRGKTDIYLHHPYLPCCNDWVIVYFLLFLEEES